MVTLCDTNPTTTGIREGKIPSVAVAILRTTPVQAIGTPLEKLTIIRNGARISLSESCRRQIQAAVPGADAQSEAVVGSAVRPGSQKAADWVPGGIGYGLPLGLCRYPEPRGTGVVGRLRTVRPGTVGGISGVPAGYASSIRSREVATRRCRRRYRSAAPLVVGTVVLPVLRILGFTLGISHVVAAKRFPGGGREPGPTFIGRYPDRARRVHDAAAAAEGDAVIKYARPARGTADRNRVRGPGGRDPGGEPGRRADTRRHRRRVRDGRDGGRDVHRRG